MKREVDIALTQLQSGHQEGLAVLYDLTRRAVFAFVLPFINDVQLAEDVMQETYVKAYQAIASYRPGTNGLNWLFTIAKNMAMTILERRRREEPVDYDDQRQPTGASRDHYEFDGPTIALAKKILPEDEQQILFLYVIGEYKHREIAALLEMPIGTVTWKYQLAIKKMKESLMKETRP
ncbi:MAG: RNA polymerase sigma factor [Bacilli bacterium]|jgi:RNA polymerase sigma-70 factor (ECF subfamily)